MPIHDIERAVANQLVVLDLRVVVTSDTAGLAVISALVDAVPGVCAASEYGVLASARYAPDFKRNGVRVTQAAMRQKLADGR